MRDGRHLKQSGQRMTAGEYNALLASSQRVDRADDHEFALRGQFPYGSVAQLDDRLTSPDNIQEWRYAVIVPEPTPQEYGTPTTPVDPPELVGAQYWVEVVHEVSPTKIATTTIPKPPRDGGTRPGRGRTTTPPPPSQASEYRDDTMFDPLEFKTLNSILWEEIPEGTPEQQAFRYEYLVATNINELDIDDPEGGTSNVAVGTIVKLLVMRKPNGIGKFYFWGGGGSSSTHLAVAVGGDDDGSQFVTVRAVEKTAPTVEGGAITWKFTGDPQPVLCMPGEHALDFKYHVWPGTEIDSTRTKLVRVTKMDGDWYAERLFRETIVPATVLPPSDCRMPEDEG